MRSESQYGIGILLFACSGFRICCSEICRATHIGPLSAAKCSPGHGSLYNRVLLPYYYLIIALGMQSFSGDPEEWASKLSPIHTADADETKLSSLAAVCTHRRRDETVLSRWRRRCEHNSRRLPTDSVDNFKTDQTDSIAFNYTNFDKYRSGFEQWRHYVVTVEKVISIYQNSRSQDTETDTDTVCLASFKIVDRIRRQSWASCDLRSHRRRLRDATRQWRRVSACMRTVYIRLRFDLVDHWAFYKFSLLLLLLYCHTVSC